MNFAERLKQLLWKSRQLISLQLHRSKSPETFEGAIGQRCEAVAAQVQLQQVPLQVMKDLWRQVLQLVVRDVQGGEALQVEQRSIESFQFVLTQVDHLQLQSIEKTGRQVIQGILAQVQQFQGAQIVQIPWTHAGAGIDAV